MVIPVHATPALRAYCRRLDEIRDRLMEGADVHDPAIARIADELDQHWNNLAPGEHDLTIRYALELDTVDLRA